MSTAKQVLVEQLNVLGSQHRAGAKACLAIKYGKRKKMNLCFIKGKVIEEVEFKFFYRSKRISIARTKVLLENESIVLIKCYDEMADWLYHFIEIGDYLLIQGKIDSNMEVEMEWVKKMEK